MSNNKKQETIDDRADQSNGDDYADASSVSSTSTVGSREIGLMERLTDIFVEEGDGDLLLQRSDREDRVLQWLQALDMQVLGACRADERLKPLLKSNASSGIAEDLLLAHLSQHFEPSEVFLLARCFCIPLVSIRVGKIIKQGTLLCPSSARGDLSLTILPTSDLRLSFIGDDGLTERLLTLSSKSECSAVVIDEIPADNSGRSFLIKSPDGRVLYFWFSEKSKLLGIELILKMKDLITRKPSIAELTGISESRLGYLATHLRAFLVGSSLSDAQAGCPSSLSPSFVTTSDLSDSIRNGQCLSSSLKSHSGSQALKANSIYQGSLSPRSSSFKEGLPRILSSLRSAARDKLRRRGDGYSSAVDNLTVQSPVTTDESCSNQSESDGSPEAKSCQLSSNLLESLGKLAAPPVPSLATQALSIGLPLFSPYYCWCPPSSSSLQYPTIPTQFPLKSSSESLSVPPLSSLLSANRSTSLLKPTPPCSLADIPALDFPAFLPDPLVRLQVPNSQQIPTFTPLNCDPIVHIPVIDVCSSGQGYLVSAGPAISATIPPLHSKLVNPLIPESDPVMETGARETLRLLISCSSQNNPPLMDVLPAVLTRPNETQSMLVAGSRGLYCGTRDVIANETQSVLVAGSRGLYCGTRDVDANETQSVLVTGSWGLFCGTRDVDVIGKSIALVSHSGSSTIGDAIVAKGCDDSLEKLDAQPEDEKSKLQTHCKETEDSLI